MGKNAKAAAAASDKAKGAPQGGKGRKNKLQRPPDQPKIRKVPSKDGQFKADGGSLVNSPLKKSPDVAHAGAGFLRAPSPKALPLPPQRWKLQPSVSAEIASCAPPPPLRRASSVRRELQGNLLYVTLKARFPASAYSGLAEKMTGMLLEGLDSAELAQILADERARDEAIQGALEVLRDDASDERAIRALACPEPARGATMPSKALKIDVAAAQEVAHEGMSSSSLTPALAALGMRISPRMSSNRYQTANIIREPLEEALANQRVAETRPKGATSFTHRV